MNQPLLAGFTVFTGEGVGVICDNKYKDGELYYVVQLPGTNGFITTPATEVRTPDEECKVQANVACITVMREANRVNKAIALGAFPDMSKVTLPYDPAAFETLNKNLRRFFAMQPYRPDELGEDFEAWLSLNRYAVRIRLAWAPEFHEAMLLKAKELGTHIPNDARPLAIGSRGGKNKERGPKGYVWFPIPTDLTTIRAEFQAKITDECRPGEIEIANVRLALGLMVMGFPLTHYTHAKATLPDVPLSFQSGENCEASIA